MQPMTQPKYFPYILTAESLMRIIPSASLNYLLAIYFTLRKMSNIETLFEQNEKVSHKCVMMILFNVANISWISVPCDQKILDKGSVVCMRRSNSRTFNIIHQQRTIQFKNYYKDIAEKINSGSTFRCLDGTFLSADVICDGVMHCINGEDESHCQCVLNGTLRNDSLYCATKCRQPWCFCDPLFIYNTNRGGCQKYFSMLMSSYKVGLMLRNGMSVTQMEHNGTNRNSKQRKLLVAEKCLYKLDIDMNIITGTMSASEMFGHCENVLIPSSFSCLSYYSVPWSYVCNGQWDCPHGLDEGHCSYSSCPGFFKCIGSTICLWSNSLCDGVRECPDGDDEYLCVEEFSVLPLCPHNCSCLLYAIMCESVTNLQLEAEIFKPYLSVNLTAVSISDKIVRHFPKIIFLVITSSTFQSSLCQVLSSFNHVNFLQSAEISRDEVSMLRSGCFKKLSKLSILNLTINSISLVHRSFFTGLGSLLSLDLSVNRLSYLTHEVFEQLSLLQHINIVGNVITWVDRTAFVGTTLTYIATETFQVCCLLNAQQSVQCTSSPPWPSTCHGQMLRPFYQTVSFIMSVFILASNGFASIINLIALWKKRFTGAFKLQLAFLYILDILYGCSLMATPFADFYYGNTYRGFEVVWRNSGVCHMISGTQLFSACCIPLLLALIALSRYQVVRNPMHSKFKEDIFSKQIIMHILTAGFLFTLATELVYIFESEQMQPSEFCILFGDPMESNIILLISIFLLVEKILIMILIPCFYALLVAKIIQQKQELNEEYSIDPKIRIRIALAITCGMTCWVSYSVVLSISMAYSKMPLTGFYMSVVIIFPMESMVNPWAYTILGHVKRLTGLLSKIKTKCKADAREYSG